VLVIEKQKKEDTMPTKKTRPAEALQANKQAVLSCVLLLFFNNLLFMFLYVPFVVFMIHMFVTDVSVVCVYVSVNCYRHIVRIYFRWHRSHLRVIRIVVISLRYRGDECARNLLRGVLPTQTTLGG
jgi:hypothetical protein